MSRRLRVCRGCVAFAALVAALAALAVLGVLGCPPGVAGADLPLAPGELAERLSRHLHRPEFSAATWGLEVLTADTGSRVFATNEHRLLKPASNAKLFTAALALDCFGPDHRIRTELIPTGPLSGRGVLRGDLILRGRGDFSFAARFHDGNTERVLDPIVNALRAAGVRRIEGALVADDSFFPGAPFGSGWTWDDLQFYYGAEVSALTVDDNVIDLVFHPGPRPGDPVRLERKPDLTYLDFETRTLTTGPTGSVRRITLRRDPGSARVLVEGNLPAGGAPWPDAMTVPAPARYFAARLQQQLERCGIRVRGGSRSEPGAADRVRPGRRAALRSLTVESQPMAELVERMLKASQNLYAQLLLLQAGTTVPALGPAETAEERGVRALSAWLGRAGIPSREVLLDEGSGLSRSCLVTPAALVQLLLAMDRHPQRDAFLHALPVAGVDGTLRNRLEGPPTGGNLRAKTGSLRYVHSLSGFVTNTAGQRLVFAVLLNAYDPPPGGPSGREALDEVARLLAGSAREPMASESARP